MIYIASLDYEKWGRTDGRTPCVNIVITTGRVQVGLGDQIQPKTMFATGVTMGLAEWIIDDTCLVITDYSLQTYLVNYAPLTKPAQLT